MEGTRGMSKVYLISQPSLSRSRDHQPKNLERLYDHGEVQVLVQAGEHVAFQPERMMRLIAQRLSEFDPEADFIAHVGGDPLATLMTGMVLADMSCDEEKGFDRVRWLRYDRPEDGRGGRTHIGAKYIPTDVMINPESLEAESAVGN